MKRLRDIASVDRRQTVCGKYAYDCVKDARLAMLVSWKAGVNVRSFYKCPVCGRYHLTSGKAGGIRRV